MFNWLQGGQLRQRFPDCGGSGTGGGGAVNTVFGRSGDVIAMIGDYNVSQITGAAASATRVIAGSGLTGGGALTGDVTLNANVVSVFGRTGPITAQAGDYTAAKVTNAVDSSSYYSDPTWLDISWTKVNGKPTSFPPSAHTHAASDVTSGIFSTALLGSGVADSTTFLRGDGLWAVPPTGSGGGPSPVTTVFGRIGDIVAQSGDYTAAQVTNALSSLGSYSDPIWLTSLAWGKLSGVPTLTNTVFGRSGNVVAQSGDYTAAQVTNALSSLGAYANPAWLTSVDWSIVGNKPSTFTPAPHTHDAADVISGVFSTARLGTGTADATKVLKGDGTWGVGGGAQTPWTQNIEAAGFDLMNLGNLYFKVDATYDIGMSGAQRSRYFYNALDIFAGGAVSAINFLKLDASGSIVYVNHAGGTNNGIYGLTWDKTNELLQLYSAGAPRFQITGAGHLLATTDNAYDIGASLATRPRNAYLAGSITLGAASSYLKWPSKAQIGSNSDGRVNLLDSGGTSFSFLNLGGQNASYPMLKRNAAGIDFRVGDDTAYSPIATGNLTVNGTATTTGSVGIGMAPSAPLWVHVATDRNLDVYNDATFGSVCIGSINDANNAIQPLAFNASKYSIMNGNVGIGTTSTNGALQVRAGTDSNALFRGPQNLSQGFSLFSVNDANSVVKGIELCGSPILINGLTGIQAPSPVGQFCIGTSASSATKVWSHNDQTVLDTYVNSTASGDRFCDFVVGGAPNGAAGASVLRILTHGLANGSTPQIRFIINNSGHVGMSCPSAANDNALIANGSVYMWVSEGANQLTFKVKYSNGTIRTGVIALS